MVTKSSCAAVSPANPPKPVGFQVARRLLLAAVLAGFAPRARSAAAEPPLTVGVRSAVERPPANAPGPLAGLRRYALLEIQLIASAVRLVKPVDEPQLLRQLFAALAARGFQPAGDHQKPEILLTVQYGRGWLKNPYRSSAGDVTIDSPAALSTGGGGAATDPNLANAESFTGLSTQFMDRLSPGYEAELQKASYEKLLVRVTAWAYPTDPKARAQRLWQTTMVVDDPDHRDLNLILPQMFAAGALYFDRPTEQGEVSVSRPAAIAEVRVGIPVTLGETVPTAPAVRAPAPAPLAAVVPAVRMKRFALPAGEAGQTLQAFSRQSGEEIIYPADQVRTVRTHAVSGEFSVRSALGQMLDQTGLAAEWDEKSGIWIIRATAR